MFDMTKIGVKLISFNALLKKIIEINYFKRRLILIFLDISLILTSILFSIFLTNTFSLGFGDIFTIHIILIFFIAIPLFIATGQYKSLSKYVGSRTLYELIIRNFFLILLTIIIGFLFNNPLSIDQARFLIVFFLCLTSLTGFIRFGIRDLLLNLEIDTKDKFRNVVIYGTDSSAAQLFVSLKLSGNYKILFFLDQNRQFWNRRLYNIPIISPDKLRAVSSAIDQVLIGSKFNDISSKKQFLNLLEDLDLPVLEMLSIEKFTNGKLNPEDLQPIDINDLLGRESSDSKIELSLNYIHNKVIFVTGAGGSIGSELCRKIILLEPKLLILLENNEASLYAINNELNVKKKVQIKPILGSIGNKFLLKKIFREFNVNIVFHAAAYKHVPIVQDNPLEGIRNNVLYTRTLCEVAMEEEINNLILISTDKAVRPTNIMGASKRVAELIFQSFAEENILRKKMDPQFKGVIFSMVRFGNVLGSSGSVVPLFQKQISEGGPVTLTDSNIVRYFMTIPEAAQLVIQSAGMSSGGELFLLDMGKPVKIQYLAEQMIRLNGLKLKSEKNPDGDIEIIVTGLRPGEKLYEELLIDGKSEETIHPRIFRSRESSFNKEKLWDKLDEIKFLDSQMNEDKILKIISELVPEWIDKRF